MPTRRSARSRKRWRTSTGDIAKRPASKLATAAVAVGFAMAAGLWAVRFFGGKGPVHAAEWWIGDLALASVFAVPAFIGLLAIRRRPSLLLGAGILSLVLSVALLVSVATLPLVVPGVMYLIAYRHAGSPGGRTAVPTMVAFLAVTGALALLVLTPRTIVCWRDTTFRDGRTELVRDRASERASSDGSFSSTSGPPRADVLSEESGCTEGVFPPTRSLAAIGLVAAAVFVTWRLVDAT